MADELVGTRVQYPEPEYTCLPDPGFTQEENRYLRAMALLQEVHFVGTDLEAPPKPEPRRSDCASWPDANETRSLTGMEPICIFEENQPWMADPERGGVVCAFVGGQVLFVGEDEVEDHPWSHGATYAQYRGEAMRSVIIRKAKALQK